MSIGYRSINLIHVPSMTAVGAKLMIGFIITGTVFIGTLLKVKKPLVNLIIYC